MEHTYPNTRPFLLMEGGPLYHIEERVGLVKANAPLTKKRAAFAAAFTWLPLLILSAIQGTAFGHKVAVPFLRDYGEYTRFLLAVPLLLLAEIILGPRIAEAAKHFVTSGIVTEEDFPAFDAAVEDGLRLRDSIPAEIVIAILAYIISIVGFKLTSVHISTWYATHTDTGATTTFAGWWMVLICVPLYQFLMLRWIWRLFLWFRFLAHVSRLNLQLFPTHPDESGGLGFVGEVQRFFGILLFAYSFGIAGVMANSVIYDKVPLTQYVPAIIAYAVLALLLLSAPLAVFTPKLIALKRTGLQNYGALATAYTGSFQRKWIKGNNPENEPLLGTGDLQSLADLGNSYSIIERMNVLPVNPRSLLYLTLSTVLPMAPLLLTVIPLAEVLKILAKLIM